MRSNVLRLTLMVVAAGIAASAASQTVAPEPPEVVVATGFRPESLAETTQSVVVIDAGDIEAREARHLESVIAAAANVTMTSGAARGRFVQVRGVGDLEQFVDPKHYPSVGVSIDGIDVGGIASAAMLFDASQVEVLRGPQGTRFGASALAGQVNVVTAAPGEAFEARLETGIGSYGEARVGLAAGGALAESVTARIAVEHHRGDGYIDNVWLGRDDTNGYDETLLRTKLRWAASEQATVNLTALRFESDNGYDAFSLDNTRETLSDEPGRDRLELTAVGIGTRWDLRSGSAFEVNLGWLDSDTDYGYDEDWTYIGICDGTLCDPVFDFFSNTDRYARERSDRSVDLRWLGETEAGGHRLEFVAGVYVQDRTEGLTREYYGPFASDYSTDRTAVYGQLDFGLTDRLGLTLGARLEQFDDRYADSFGASTASDDDLSSGELAFRYSVNDVSSVYFSLSRGVKPGTVNTEASSVLPFVQTRFRDFLSPRLTVRRESLDNIEFGLRHSFGAGSIRAALFAMDRNDAQLESWFWDPVNYLWVGILDSAEGSNLGVELDLDFAPTSRWHLRASVGLLETEVEAITSFDLDRDAFVERLGIEQTQAPSWQASVGSRWDIGDTWRLSIDVDARDSYRYGYYHDATIGGATLLHARLSKMFGPTELSFWSRNLLDEDVAVHGLYFGNDPRKGWVPERYLQLGEPRLAGLEVRYEF